MVPNRALKEHETNSRMSKLDHLGPTRAEHHFPELREGVLRVVDAVLGFTFRPLHLRYGYLDERSWSGGRDGLTY